MGQRVHPMVAQLSKIGSDQHALEGLRKLLGSVGLLSMQTKLPVSEQVDTMVLPSSLVRLLHEHYPRDFKVLLGADPQKLREFWSSFLGGPRSARWAQRHPALRDKVAADLICTVPCVVHSDAGPCTKAKSTNCVSWSALLGSGGEKSSKFLVCSALNSTAAETGQAGNDFYKTSSKATGVVGGKEVARDKRRLWRFVLSAAKADEEVRCNEWGLPHFGGAENCSDCLCNKSTRPHTDLQASAAGRPTADMDCEGWVARIREPVHPLLKSDAICDRWSIFMADCHGVSAIVYGGVLGLILDEHHLGRTQLDRPTFVNEFMLTWYAEHPGANRLPRLRRNNLLNDGWWELSGQVIKAAAMRSAAPSFAELANATHVGDNPRAAQARRLAELFDAFYTAVYAAPLVPFGHGHRQGQSDHQRVRRSDHELAGGQHASQQVVLQDHNHSTQAHARTIVHGGDEPAVAASVPGGPDRVSRQDLAPGVKVRYERQIQSNVLLRRYLGLPLRLEL